MFTLLLAALLTPTDDVSAWPGFLGANASPVEPASIPLEWSPEKNIAWTAEIPGHGQSSPVIYGEHAFVTSCDGPNKERLHVLCLQLSDGSVVWDTELESTNPEKNSLYISRAAPTPVVDAKHVFAYFESGDVFALTHDGDVAWQISLTEKYGKPQNGFGLSASPVQTDDSIIVLIDDDKSRGGPANAPPAERAPASYLAALKKSDGSTLWRTNRSNRTSWSSPAMVSIGGESVVVCSSAGSVDGYSPEDGRMLFSFTDVGGNTVATPMPVGDGEFLVAASPGRGEGGPQAEKAKQSNGLMRVSKAASGFKAEFVWTNSKAAPSFSSPIVHKGYAYWVNRTGAVFCLDAKTGESVYTARLQAAWATPVGLGDRIYFFAQKKGITSVIAAGPEFNLLATNTLWDEEPGDDSLQTAEPETGERAAAASRFSGQTTYGAAMVSGSLLIRTGNRVYCVRD